MTLDRAREITYALQENIDQRTALLAEAYAGRVWTVLGYDTWENYCRTEFGSARALPPPERKAAVRTLRGHGMSTRAIGTALGVSPETIRRDIAEPTATNVAVESPGQSAPAQVVSLDGRLRPAIQPAQPSTPTETNTHPPQQQEIKAAQTLLASLRKLHKEYQKCGEAWKGAYHLSTEEKKEWETILDELSLPIEIRSCPIIEERRRNLNA